MTHLNDEAADRPSLLSRFKKPLRRFRWAKTPCPCLYKSDGKPLSYYEDTPWIPPLHPYEKCFRSFRLETLDDMYRADTTRIPPLAQNIATTGELHFLTFAPSETDAHINGNRADGMLGEFDAAHERRCSPLPDTTEPRVKESVAEMAELDNAGQKAGRRSEDTVCAIHRGSSSPRFDTSIGYTQHRATQTHGSVTMMDTERMMDRNPLRVARERSRRRLVKRMRINLDYRELRDYWIKAEFRDAEDQLWGAKQQDLDAGERALEAKAPVTEVEAEVL
jgi:hypothetical protein